MRYEGKNSLVITQSVYNLTAAALVKTQHVYRKHETHTIIIDSSLRVRACIYIHMHNNSFYNFTHEILSTIMTIHWIRTIESDRALAAAQKVHLHLRVRLHCEFCVFCFVTVKSALFARNYHIFGMLFIPKTIIIFNFYLVIFGVLYVVKLKLALEIFACPIRASIFCRCSKMLLPDSNFYLPRAIGQALMSHPAFMNHITMKDDTFKRFKILFFNGKRSTCAFLTFCFLITCTW